MRGTPTYSLPRPIPLIPRPTGGIHRGGEGEEIEGNFSRKNKKWLIKCQNPQKKKKKLRI